MAWWSWFTEGDFSNPDEYPGEVLEEYSGVTWLGVPMRARRRLHSELRDALERLLQTTDPLGARGAERVTLQHRPVRPLAQPPVEAGRLRSTPARSASDGRV